MDSSKGWSLKSGRSSHTEQPLSLSPSHQNLPQTPAKEPQFEISQSLAITRNAERASVYPSPGNNSGLENLPAEIRLHILSFKDLVGLKSLVFASPVYHAQCLLDRRFLLSRSIESTLRGVTIDACAAYQSGARNRVEARSKQRVSRWLTSYRKKLRSNKYSIPNNLLDLDVIIKIARVHIAVVTPLVRHYAEWALSNYSKENKKDDMQGARHLSKTEETRILRGLYRFEIYCNLYAPSHTKVWGRTPRAPSSMVFLAKFIYLFEPWEVEELCCIYYFPLASYVRIFRAIGENYGGPSLRYCQFQRGEVCPLTFQYYLTRG